jgi:sulfoxide reductase heme-binding subunit YedZ
MFATALLLQKLSTSWPWYVARASGLVAAIVLALLILSGVGLLTGLTYRWLEPLAAWRAHRSLGIALLVAVMVHIFTLLFDTFVGFSLLDLLIPFHSHYDQATIGGWHPGALYLTFGVIGLYVMLAIVVTSLLWINKKPRPWRLTHFLSYVLLGLVFFHGLFTGTDLKHGLVRFVWLVSGIVLLYALVQRLRRAFTISGEDVGDTGRKESGKGSSEGIKHG